MTKNDLDRYIPTLKEVYIISFPEDVGPFHCSTLVVIITRCLVTEDKRREDSTVPETVTRDRVFVVPLVRRVDKGKRQSTYPK